MEKCYAVTMGAQELGKVRVQRQGLYYRFLCRCRLSGDVMCRLNVCCGGRQESLGVVVPMEDGFGLDTRLPVKRLGEGEMEFSLVPRHGIDTEDFVPIYPEEPFTYIERLKEGFLARKGAQLGIAWRG